MKEEEKQVPEYISRYMESMQKELDQEKIARMQLQNQNAQNSAFPPMKDQNLVEYQLDLKEELDRIYHLLSGHLLTVDNDGNEIWVEPSDDRLKIFSDYGVKQIMNIVSFYINRNTLLSNYDDKTIIWKIRDFGTELADLIFNRYEVFFHYPTPEDLFEKYLPIVKKNHVDISEKELYWKCVQWSKEELQSKLRHYPMICLSLVDSVHSTYLRAYRGEERTSLRKFLHVSQSANQEQPLNVAKPRFSLTKPSTWTG